MGLLDFFKKHEKEPPVPAKPDPTEELEIYSGMRGEVTAFDGRLLFVAKRQGLRGNMAEVQQ